MAAARYCLKAVPIWAEQVPTELADILEVAERWGAEVRVHPETGITLRLPAALGSTMAQPGDWLMDKPGEGKGCCPNEEFTASFDPAGE